MNLLLRGIRAFDRREDDFQFLSQHALDFKELVLVFLTELLGPRKTHVVIKLLPAFQVVLDLNDQVVQFLAVHKIVWLRLLFWSQGTWSKENDGAASQLAGRQFERRIIDDQLRQGKIHRAGGTERGQHLVTNLAHLRRRK